MLRRFHIFPSFPSKTSMRFHASCCGGNHDHHDSHHPHPSHVAEFLKHKNSNDAPVSNPDIDQCRRLTWIGAGVNVVYSVLKISLGSAGGSVALVADGLHAVVDVLSDAVAIGSLYLARQPRLSKRCRFPFGTGRAETVGAVIIALILTLGAFSVAWAAMEKLFDFAATPEKQLSALKRRVFGGANSEEGLKKEETKTKSSSCSHDHDHSGLSMFAHDHSFEILKEDSEGLKLKDRIIWSMLFVAGSSIFAKEVLYRLMRKAGEKAGSASTIANAYHHRADAMSAALGLLGVVSSAYGLELVDALAGLGVAAVILQLGGRTLKGSVLQFFDYQGGDLKDIRNISRGDSDKGTAVNVFATRHGLQVVLHGTLMMRKDATCVDVAYLESMILEKVKKAHPNVLFDVFFKVRPLIVPAHHHHHHDSKSTKSKLEEEDENNLETVLGFTSALNEVAQFHGINYETSVERNDKEKIVKILQDVGDDCKGDIERCANLFGYDVVYVFNV